jgi:hypothetical protein
MLPPADAVPALSATAVTVWVIRCSKVPMISG